MITLDEIRFVADLGRKAVVTDNPDGREPAPIAVDREQTRPRKAGGAQ
ncbi:hypothetical protein [Sinosporangium album]|nr:hypothetical protein [Sinosporangium album]